MKSLPEPTGPELTWTVGDPSRRTFVLRAGDREIGSLELDDETGRHATGKLGGREWAFERVGALHPRVRIRATDSGETVAEVILRWTGSGVISFDNSVRYCWQPDKVLTTKWSLRRDADNKLICFMQEGGLSTRGSKVVPYVDCEALPQFPVLVLLGWYLRVLMSNRLSSAAVSCGQ